MPYKIENKIPLPSRKGVEYPFAEMKVGDSFEFDLAERSKIISAASYYGIRHNPIKFSIRGCRVWRVK